MIYNVSAECREMRSLDLNVQALTPLPGLGSTGFLLQRWLYSFRALSYEMPRLPRRPYSAFVRTGNAATFLALVFLPLPFLDDGVLGVSGWSSSPFPTISMSEPGAPGKSLSPSSSSPAALSSWSSSSWPFSVGTGTVCDGAGGERAS